MSSDTASPWGASPGASVVETHISVVFFVGDRAYKLKKPVQFPFADFTTREARETVCHREVQLNRRLAPDVYLGVADVLGTDGQPCDHLVVMRRMPDERRLALLVQSGDDDAAQAIDDLARQLASFHASAERSPAIDRAASAGAVAQLWEENFSELHPFGDTVVDAAMLSRASQLVSRFISGRNALFLERIAGGHVCDGHGDLQADDVFCLPDGVRILDCIEFFDEFRFGDVASDIAFLAMDLERLGAAGLSRRFIAAYEAASGQTIPTALLDFYIAYRAQIRAKVACLRTLQQEPGSSGWEASAERARQFLDVCLRHLEAASVRLVVIGGLPGTGKSTVATDLAATMGATLLRSDVVRKELAGLAPSTPARSDDQTGLYTTDVTERVYRELFTRAAHHLDVGRSVVIDASFANEQFRQRARALAGDTFSELTELRCVLDAGIADARIRHRSEHEHDASDATPELAAAIASRFAPWPEATELPTSVPPADAAALALAAVAPSAP